MDAVVPVHRPAPSSVRACRMVPQGMFGPTGLKAPEIP